jgi:hypothetical protein
MTQYDEIMRLKAENIKLKPKDVKTESKIEPLTTKTTGETK